MKFRTFVLVAFVATYLSITRTEGSSTNTAKLKFKISGRNLIDQDGFSTTDGYVKVFYTHDGGKTIKSLGRTEVILDKKNPDWEKVFEFHFDRKLKQYWYFHVCDHDPFKIDDSVGKVWTNVADYVDKNQLEHANLDYGGYITVKALPEAGRSQKGKGPSGILPFRPGTPNSKRIRFKVSTRGLSRNTNHYETLVITIADGVNGKERQFGRATTVTASFNPLWKPIYTLDWNKSKDQRLHFKVYDAIDNKTLRDVDIVGDAWIQANDFIFKVDSYTVLLPQKGALTITKV